MVIKMLLKVYLSLYTLLRSHLFVNCCIKRYSLYSLLVFCKALPLASEFPTFYERFFMMFLNSSSASLMKKIPRDFLALSSLGFSIAHFCFALHFDAPDRRFRQSGHTLLGLEVVCFLVSLHPDHVYPSSGLRVNKMNLVKLVHAPDNPLSPSTFQ